MTKLHDKVDSLACRQKLWQKPCLDEWQVTQPPELHGEAPSGENLKLIVWVLLEVMDFIDWSQEVAQKDNVGLVPFTHAWFIAA